MGFDRERDVILYIWAFYLYKTTKNFPVQLSKLRALSNMSATEI
ncbi:hypothetical protein SAMD00079811_24070 [Scytonema sp. HK-05]|nr:hypothetical protein SAMD00079811_24070 [Scytonema sp. HK-05]